MTPAQLNALRRLCNPESPPPLEPGEIEAIKAAVEIIEPGRICLECIECNLDWLIQSAYTTGRVLNCPLCGRKENTRVKSNL